MTSGIAILTASIGRASISPPFRLNIAMIVNSSATSVIGLIAGKNFWSYHSVPFERMSAKPHQKSSGKWDAQID
jgi:hypothetical protein